MKQGEDIRHLVDHVQGWLSSREGALLYRLARQCRGAGVIVEIGSWEGKSTIWLARGAQQGQRVSVYAIDPHTGAANPDPGQAVWTFDNFRRNIRHAAVDDLVVPLVMTSAAAARDFDAPVELLFIDGAHDYEDLWTDFVLWFPRLIDGGIIAFHDTMTWSSWDGPRAFVERHIFPSRRFRAIGVVDSITFAQKVPHNSFSDRLRNRLVLLLKRFYEYAARVPVPRPLKKAGERVFKAVLHRSAG
jgi:predicted O-methyltransferase YrrM